VPVHDLVVHPRERELVAGTHGRSIWIVDVLPLQDLVESGDDTALKVFFVDDVKASRGWRSKRSRWYFDPEEAPRSTIRYWSTSAGKATIEVVDSHDTVVRRMSSDAVKGMNRFEWDLLVDEELALAAESAALEKAREGEKDGGKTARLADKPYSESVRLGHALYAIPGDYSIRVSLGEHTDNSDLKIKAPKDYEPRQKEPYKIRGRK